MEQLIIQLLVAISLLLVGLNLVRRFLPGVMNPLIRIARRALSGFVQFLWSGRERQGAARAQPPQFRYRR